MRTTFTILVGLGLCVWLEAAAFAANSVLTGR